MHSIQAYQHTLFPIEKWCNKRTALGLTVILATFSLNRSCNKIAAVALRTVGLITSVVICSQHWWSKSASRRDQLMSSIKVGAVATGLLGVICSSNSLIKASLVTDIVLQLFGQLRSIHEKASWKMAEHFFTN